MKELNIRGCGTALLTPFINGQVDYVSYRLAVERQVKAGIDFLVPLGTTAEAPCLTIDEKVRLLEATRQCGAGKTIIAGAGTNSLVHTIENMHQLEPHGVDGFLVVVPYYNKPTQEGLYSYFSEVASATEKPIVLYNAPGRTGANLTAETTLKLAQLPNVVAIKEASGNYEQVSEILRCATPEFTVLSGNDNETLSLMATGAHGVISVASNVVPELMVALVNALRTEDLHKARELHFRLSPLFKGCFVESNPIPAKAAMNLLGLMRSEMRSPLLVASEKTQDMMRVILQELQMIKKG